MFKVVSGSLRRSYLVSDPLEGQTAYGLHRHRAEFSEDRLDIRRQRGH